MLFQVNKYLWESGGKKKQQEERRVEWLGLKPQQKTSTYHGWEKNHICQINRGASAGARGCSREQPKADSPQHRVTQPHPELAQNPGRAWKGGGSPGNRAGKGCPSGRAAWYLPPPVPQGVTFLPQKCHSYKGGTKMFPDIFLKPHAGKD